MFKIRNNFVNPLSWQMGPNPHVDYGELNTGPTACFTSKFQSPNKFGRATADDFLSDTAPNPKGKGPNPPKSRKLGASTFDENDTSPHHSRGGRNGRSKIKGDHHWPIIWSGGWSRERNMRHVARVIPLFSQKRAFRDRVEEVDTWFRNSANGQLVDFWEMVEMLKGPISQMVETQRI